MPMHKDFLFFDLDGLTPGKPFPGFAVGTFADRIGREVSFAAKDLPVFLVNTLARIQEYKTKNMPGLPIDARNHDRADAAGWIVGAEQGEVTDSNGESVAVLSIVAEWTKLGVGLIKDKIQANFSPNVDLVNKVIVGGSLTNWPATVDEKGIPLFTAIELADGIKHFEMIAAENEPVQAIEEEPNESDEVLTMNITKDDLAELVAGQVKGALESAVKTAVIEKPAEPDTPAFDVLHFLEMQDAGDEVVKEFKQAMLDQYDIMRERASTEASQMIASIRREATISEFTQQVTAGTSDIPRGLPVKPDDLKTWLLTLNPAQLGFATQILGDIQASGVIEFRELGHGRQLQGAKEVPDYAQDSLKAALAAGNSAKAFFDAAELGAASDYNLTDYEVKKNG